MSEKPNIDDLDLSDAELMKVLTNHGINRRLLMKIFGAGAVTAALGGTAAAKQPGGASTDEIYGAPYEASESVPSGVVDQLCELHLHFDPSTSAPPEFFFDPVGIHLTSQEVINYHVHGGLHTVTAVDSKYDEPGVFDFPDRVPTDNGFTSPVMNTGDSWLYRFVTPGIYDIMCLPHYGLGMVMRVVVTKPNGSVPTDTYDDSSLPPAVKAVFNAPELEPQNIVDEGTVAWDDLSI